MRSARALAALAVAAGLGVVGQTMMVRAQPKPPLVMAAASLKTALDHAIASWQQSSGGTGEVGARVSYAGSHAVIRQLQLGAPADLVIVADRGWMDFAERRRLIDAASRVDLLGNRLVLIAPSTSTVDVQLEPGVDLVGALQGGRLAVGQVQSVPAGKYAKAALLSLGAWASVRDRLAPAANVRAALAMVARGEAPLGIVYWTDAKAEPAVRVVATFPADSHPPIVYPAAVVAASRSQAARQLFEFLKSAAARPAFEAQGFTVLR